MTKRQQKIITQLICRKLKTTQKPLLFYADVNKNQKFPLTCFDGSHGKAGLSYYRLDTKPAEELECQHLLDIFKTYLKNGEIIKLVKKLKINKMKILKEKKGEKC